MSVYVDYPTPCIKTSRWPYNKSCHLFSDANTHSDQVAELLSFALLIGLRQSWIQLTRKDFPHFDLTEAKRDRAISRGAIICGREKVVEVIGKNRGGLK